MVDYLQTMYELAYNGEKQGILFWISLYTLLVVGFSATFQIRVRRWPSTQGYLIQSGTVKFGATEWVKSEQEYSAKALYIYLVDGEIYEGTRLSPWIIVASHNAKFVIQKQLEGIERHTDGTIGVIYNPKNPRKSYLIKPGLVGLLITILIAVLPMVFFLKSY